MTILTTQQAAAELGISRRRVLKLIEVGRLKADRVGRDYVIKPRALDAVRNRKVGRPAKA